MRYLITATDKTGQEVQCFTWTRDPKSGIARAKREAVEFGMDDLHDFRAYPILPMAGGTLTISARA